MHVRGKSGHEFSADSKKVLFASFRPCSYLTVFQDSGLDGIEKHSLWIYDLRFSLAGRGRLISFFRHIGEESNPHRRFAALCTQSHTRTTAATTTKWKPRVGGGGAYLCSQSGLGRRLYRAYLPEAAPAACATAAAKNQKRTKTSTIKVDCMLAMARAPCAP